jgi:predicted CoA-substrate-specific enzyme activase
MITIGIDIGSRAAKCVAMDNGNIIAGIIRDTGPDSVKTSQDTLKEVMKKAGLSPGEIAYTMATGYGRVLVPSADENISEISCHARGINYYFPSVRTILDMGGQDCKAINCDERGTVTNFVMNDKCAGGTGRFLEIIAEVLNVPLEEIGDISLTSRSAIVFNTICAVFAKSDAIAQLRQGKDRSDILAGLNEAIAVRCLSLLKRVTVEEDFSITGGIAKNRGMVAKLREKVGLEPRLAEDPQLIGALGAALFARERAAGGAATKTMRMSYGYSDGSGEYFITVDAAGCDGCGECLTACPAEIFSLDKDERGRPLAIVNEKSRKRLSLLCPGFEACRQANPVNCHSVCQGEAIHHSW